MYYNIYSTSSCTYIINSYIHTYIHAYTLNTYEATYMHINSKAAVKYAYYSSCTQKANCNTEHLRHTLSTGKVDSLFPFNHFLNFDAGESLYSLFIVTSYNFA